MPEKEVTLTTDLILKGQIVGVPITGRGTLENGEFAGLSGSVTIKKSLEALIADLGDEFSRPAEFLNDLTGGQIGNIHIDSLAIGYRGMEPKFTQIVVTMSAGGNTFRFVIMKMTDGVFVVGLDLLWDPKFFKNSILSGLVGEITSGIMDVHADIMTDTMHIIFHI